MHVARRGIRWGSVVIDGRSAVSLKDVSNVFARAAEAVKECETGRIVVLGTSPASAAATCRETAARRSLEGLVKSLAREVGRKGGTVNLLYTPPLIPDHAVAAAAKWFTDAAPDDPLFSFVTGQAIELNETPGDELTCENLSLSGRTVIVTGAAGGIGKAVATRCVEMGAGVLLCDAPSQKGTLEQLANHLERRYSGLSRVVAVDLRSIEECAMQMMQEAQHTDVHKPFVDIVHCAGITLDRSLKKMAPEAWEASLQVNLFAPMEITELLQRSGVLHADTSKVIAFSSVVGFGGNRGQTNYAAAKMGLRSWVDALAAKRFHAFGIAPGFIATPMTVGMNQDLLADLVSGSSCLERLGRPSEIASVVSTILSPAGNAVKSGQTVRVCGGFFW